MSNGEIFLSKGGKSVGPFTEKEIEALKKSGEIHDYTFIWDLATQSWAPITPPPAPPTASPAPASEAKAAPKPAPKAETRPEPKPEKELKIPALEAVCFDHHQVVSGHLARVTESGCRFVSHQPTDEPGFPSRGVIRLNLLNPKTGKSMSVETKVSSITRESGKWAFDLGWQECPEILR